MTELIESLNLQHETFKVTLKKEREMIKYQNETFSKISAMNKGKYLNKL